MSQAPQLTGELTRDSYAATLEALDTRLRWLSAWTIHNTNHLRNSRDGLKVGSPSTLSWSGGVRGMRTSPLGTDRFGQTGDLPDLYRTYRRDTAAIIDAAAELFLGAR